MHITVEIDLPKYEASYTKLRQLTALLTSTSGPGFEPFLTLGHDYQDQLIMLAADLAHEAIAGLAILE